MSDSIFPPRLADSAEDASVRNFVEAGRCDTVDPEEARNLLAAYMEARSAGANAQTPGVSTLAMKVLGSVIVAGAVAIGWTTYRSTLPIATSAPTSIVTGKAPAEGVPIPAAVQEPEQVMHVDELPSATPAPKPAATRPPQETSGSSLEEELALVEIARSSLAHGDPAGCLRMLGGYDRRFRSGLLADEVAAMRIEALLARGERQQARSLGSAFLAANPDSPYAARIQSILAATAPLPPSAKESDRP